MSFIYPYINGNYMSGYFSFYDFINEVLGIEYVKDWQWYKQTSEQSLVYPLDNICIYSQKPIRISLNKSGVIHCDGKMAVEFADGWGVYALNGIIVSKEIAETPAENLDPKLILNEQNADIQREIIKKIGAERVLKKLNSKCLDKWTDPKTGKYYELLNLKVGSIDRKYMYYKHFSLDYYYAKPVPPEIRTAWQGRAWILGMIERNELPNAADEVINNLPTQAS